MRNINNLMEIRCKCCSCVAALYPEMADILQAFPQGQSQLFESSHLGDVLLLLLLLILMLQDNNQSTMNLIIREYGSVSDPHDYIDDPGLT